MVTASPDQNPTLFHAVPMSYGTLGFVTLVTLKVVLQFAVLTELLTCGVQVVEYKPFIRLTYQPCYRCSVLHCAVCTVLYCVLYSLPDTMALLDSETHKQTENDSVEGIAFSRDTAVIMTGQFVAADQVLYCFCQFISGAYICFI